MNYYEILGVSENATQEEIKKAYRELSKKYHPDVNDAKNANAFFRLITEAYKGLSNGEQKSVDIQNNTKAYQETVDMTKSTYHSNMGTNSNNKRTSIDDFFDSPDDYEVIYTYKAKRKWWLSLLLFPFIALLKIIFCILWIVFGFIGVVLEAAANIATWVGGVVITLCVGMCIILLITKSLIWASILYLGVIALMGFIFPMIAMVLPFPFTYLRDLSGKIISHKF